jgi:hypothetical protein
MATPFFLELPPVYDAEGYMKTPEIGDQTTDMVMCSECRCLLNRHNQSDHIKVHEESESLRRLLMELVQWKSSLIQCRECYILFPANDKDAHDLHHGYIEDRLDERPRTPAHDQTNTVTLNTTSRETLLAGLGMREPEPEPVRYRTYKPAEIEWSTTNSILGVTTTRLAFPIDADGDGIDDAVCSLEYDNYGNLTISEQP